MDWVVILSITCHSTCLHICRLLCVHCAFTSRAALTCVHCSGLWRRRVCAATAPVYSRLARPSSPLLFTSTRRQGLACIHSYLGHFPLFRGALPLSLRQESHQHHPTPRACRSLLQVAAAMAPMSAGARRPGSGVLRVDRDGDDGIKRP